MPTSWKSQMLPTAVGEWSTATENSEVLPLASVKAAVISWPVAVPVNVHAPGGWAMAGLGSQTPE